MVLNLLARSFPTRRSSDLVCFMGESETGHAVILDGAPDAGGRNLGMRPMEMLLIGMGACTSFDVVTILRKARQPIVDCVAEIEAERADEVPKVLDRKSTRLNSSH